MSHIITDFNILDTRHVIGELTANGHRCKRRSTFRRDKNPSIKLGHICAQIYLSPLPKKDTVCHTDIKSYRTGRDILVSNPQKGRSTAATGVT